MKRNKGKTRKSKILFLIKLALVLVLGHVIIKTAVMPQVAQFKLAPNSAMGDERVMSIKSSPDPCSTVSDYSAILKRDLFGGQNKDAIEAKTPPVDDPVVRIPKSSDDELAIALIGTTAGSPAVSRAIIKNLKTNVIDVYKTGDTIQTASIQSIEKDRVVLINKGRRKVLELRTKEFAAAETNNARTKTPLQVHASSKPAGIKPPVKPLNTVADKLRHTAIMLPSAKIEPHSVAGEVEGLRISDLDCIEGAKDLGLRDGDVICAVNGHRLNSKQKAFQIAMKARSQAELNVELVRDDHIRKFSLPLK